MITRPTRSPSGRPPPLRSDPPVSFRLPANDALGSLGFTCALPAEASFFSGAPNTDDVATSLNAAATGRFAASKARAEPRESGVVLSPGVAFPSPAGTTSTYWSTDDGVSESVAAPATPAVKGTRAKTNAATKTRAAEVRASSPFVSCVTLVSRSVRSRFPVAVRFPNPALLLTSAVAASVFAIAYDNGSYGLPSRNTLAIALWWAISMGVAFGIVELGQMTRPAKIIAGLLAAFCLWTLVSIIWAPSAENAFNEFNRVSLFLAVFLLVSLLAAYDPARANPEREGGSRPVIVRKARGLARVFLGDAVERRLPISPGVASATSPSAKLTAR